LRIHDRYIHGSHSAVMMTLVLRSLAGRGLLVIVTIWTALNVTCSEISETGNLSGRRLAERSAATDKILSGAQGGDRQRRVLKDWAPGNFSVSGRQAPGPIPADTEVRRLRLYQVHTGESLAVTYKQDGRYIPSAMAQLDYFLRDWRSNSFVSISGETIDLLWELHEELGSKQPIHIISGFRSAQTNALLKRIGRNVASRSEHMLGRAIDVQFPDVPLKLLRNRALVRQAGGVGYYPAGDGGFVHIDSGRVRHWPGMSRTELAEIFAKPTGDREIGDQQAALGSETVGAQQQNGKRAGPIGRPAIHGVRQSVHAAIDAKFGNASSLASAKALLVRSLPAPGEVAPKQRSKRSLKRQDRPSSRSLGDGRAGTACCGLSLRKQAGKTGKNFSLPKRQRQFSERSAVAKKGALPVAYKPVFDVVKRTVRIASAMARKAKGLVNAITNCPVSQHRRTASRSSGTGPRCQVARNQFAGATQLSQTAKSKAKRPIPATANH
jgi:uncharacterized protein YcbK (DUF882 family)